MTTLIILLAFLLSAWLTRRFCNPASSFYILDHPGERSLHTEPVPRSGGMAILITLVFAVAALAINGNLSAEVFWLVPGVLALAAVSFLDDWLEVRPSHRLLVHLLAGVILVYGGFSLAVFKVPGLAWEWPAWLAGLFTVLFVVWMTNLYNFMDGMDGFAGGMAVFGFGTFGLLGLLAGEHLFALMNWVVAASVSGFLVWNFPPAKIFMGDTGSSILGYLAAAFSLWAARKGIFPFWVAVLIFSPFIVDATVTLARRSLLGEKVWEAHKTHYYQRLVQGGWGHRRMLSWEYLLMAASSGSALVAMELKSELQWLLLAVWLMLYLGLMIWIEKINTRKITPSA